MTGDAALRDAFLREVLRGLFRPQKELPCKYFYDVEGSRLFEEICRQPEYYLTATELSIMQAHAAEMAALIGPGCLLIEPGSGSSLKTGLLFDELLALPGGLCGYVPVDISRDQLYLTAEALRRRYPGLQVVPVCADFAAPFALPDGLDGARRVVYFPGSTIGNFEPGPARRFLGGLARLVGPGGGLLIGVDLKKDRAVLEAAYDDAAGVTAAFNLNLLVRINRELRADFQPDRFRHLAFYNEDEGRIEMHLMSRARQVVRIGPAAVVFRAGETVRTEYSYKYRLPEFLSLCADAGFSAGRTFRDAAERFAVLYLEARA
jgi:dimethylhistidine N-methyltransferase